MSSASPVLKLFTQYLKKMIGNTEAGWSSLMISIWLLGGINLVAISIVGIYIGKIFTEVKQRPLFQIETETGLFMEKLRKVDDYAMK